RAMTTAFVSSNGFITFDVGDTDFTPSIDKFFVHPRVSAFYTDLDFRTQPMGNVLWNVYSDPGNPADPAFVVTWLSAGMVPSQAANDTVQIALFKSGAIQISYDTISDVKATTSGADQTDFFMGVSCPGTPTTPAPAPTSLLTVQPQPDTMNEGRDISPWNGEPIYDFLDRGPNRTGGPTPSSIFATRYFNFLPSGVGTKAFVPIMTGGNSIQSILSDDVAQAVPITFSMQQMPDAGTPDADTMPDGACPLDAGTSVVCP